MKGLEKWAETGGWKAPCEAVDFRKLERQALREAEAIEGRLESLKRQAPGNAEQELLRRWEVRMLTDMRYEQKSNARLFSEKAKEREKMGAA